MLRELFSGLLPDTDNLLPPSVQATAQTEIRRYWRTRGWQLVLGEVILWAAAVYQQMPHPWAYGVLAGAVVFAYGVGWVSGTTLFWLVSFVAIVSLQGLVIQGLGAVTALTALIPYTISGMLFSGQRRAFIQFTCIAAFWGNLIFEVIPVAPRLEPSQSILVSYNILLAAFTFQTLRFLNHLSIEINTAYVGEEVRQQSRQFLARVSHELRTPLNSVLGFAKLLRKTSLYDSQYAYLEQIIDEGEHLDRLVGDLLDKARLNTGVISVNFDPCQINHICEIVVEEVRPQLVQGVTLAVQLDSSLPDVEGDSIRIRQAITNLLSNAAKYTAKGQVTLRTWTLNERVFVEVNDTGQGIPEAQRRLVFVPFVRLSHDQPGIGLGLDIALQIARLHGGDIHLTSQVGIGSTFTLELPIRQPKSTSTDRSMRMS